MTDQHSGTRSYKAVCNDIPGHTSKSGFYIEEEPGDEFHCNGKEVRCAHVFDGEYLDLH